MKITILTLFPEMFSGFLTESMIGRAVRDNKVEIDIVNLRGWGLGKHKQVDDTPYGGGAGMVLRPDVVVNAIKDVISNDPPLLSATERAGEFRISNEIKKLNNSDLNKNSLAEARNPGRDRLGPAGQAKFKIKNSKVILMTPQGQKFSQDKAKALADNLVNGQCDLVFVCGHYEGFDERIRGYVDEEISIGDYVLTGGELPAAVITDAVVRLLPGVLGKEESHQNESFSISSQTSNLKPQTYLEHSHYTKPEEYDGKKVPEILLSGHHANIEKWRQEQSIKRTKKRRPDLL